MQQGKNMPLLFWSHESVDMFLFLLFRFLFSEMIYIDKTLCAKQNCPVVICLVFLYLWLWQNILKFFEKYVVKEIGAFYP